jgi:hypothetical protein
LKNIITLLACVLLWAITAPAHGQDTPPKSDVKLFFEKAYLHTDRSIYAQGDDVWFKAYLVNAQNNWLINTSKNLYVELIAPSGKIVEREIVLLKEGLGKGDFQLPDTLTAGNYRLRVYTNWMRNFGNNFIFEKSIVVVSNRPALIRENNNAVTAPVTRFFPEGGSLVEGVSSLVAVKVENATAKGVATKGSIISSSGDTIAKYTTDTLGMGLFSILPLQGQAYQAKSVYAGKVISTDLPAALKNGLTLKVYKKDTLIYMVVSCNEQALSTYSAQSLTVKARSFGKVTFQQTLQLKGATAALAIPANQLPEGIASITLYDGNLKPNCERLIYVENQKKAQVTVSTDKNVYAPRERVVVNVTAKDKQGRPLPTSFSIAAVDASLVPAEESNILAYLMLQSELRGNVRYAARYFDTTNVQRTKQLDLLLMTQGWRDFVWKRLADTTLRIAYIPEQGISLSGTVQKSKQVPLAGANVTLTAPKANNGRMFFAQTNAQGKYFFDNLQLFGQQNIKVNAKDAKGKTVGTISLDSLTGNYAPITNKTILFDDAMPPATKTAALIKQVTLNKQRALSDTLIRLKDVQVKARNEQVLPDRTVTSFGYKEEVLTVKPEDSRYNTLRDYIQFASNQARVDVQTNRLQFFADGKKYTPRFVIDKRDALLNVNGDDEFSDMRANTYLDLPVSAVKQVVIKKMLGGPSLLATADSSANNPTAADNSPARASTSSSMSDVVFVIFLTLNPGALNKEETGATKANVTGYYEARTFYTPVYDVPKPSVKLDARATLHWAPNGSINASGRSTISFYNSDSKTNVRLILQGITSNGVPVTAVKTYTVK